MLTVNDLVSNINVFISPDEKYPVIEIYNLADGKKKVDFDKVKSCAVKQAFAYYNSDFDGPAGMTIYIEETED